MVTNSRNTRLFSADSFGFIYVWNVERYCVDSIEEQSAECQCDLCNNCKTTMYIVFE